VTRSLNFASRPFRNDALPSLFFYVMLAVVAGVTVKHALVLRGLLPGRMTALQSELSTLEAEAGRLRSEASVMRGPAPDPASVAEWSELKDLVDRRTFSWTRLLARLEKLVPEGVRISAIVPSVRKGQIQLDLSAQAQSKEAGFELLKRLQERPEFEDVVPVTVTGVGQEDEETKEFRYAMRYVPSASPADELAPAASEPADGEVVTSEEAEP
jgi:hypothetical protein